MFFRQFRKNFRLQKYLQNLLITSSILTSLARCQYGVVRHGTELNLQSSNGGTALMLAALFNRPAVVRRLLRAGADTAARSASGKTALQVAKQEGHAECVEAFRQHVKESVVAGRPTATAAGGEGAGGASSGGASSAGSRIAKTPSPAVTVGRASSGAAAVSDEVVAAAERGEEEAVLAWLEGGGRVDATYERGEASGLTLLMGAAVHGHERVVELLLQRGAEINVQDRNGDTALMLAAIGGHEDVCARLLVADCAAAARTRLRLAVASTTRRPARPGRVRDASSSRSGGSSRTVGVRAAAGKSGTVCGSARSRGRRSRSRLPGSYAEQLRDLLPVARAVLLDADLLLLDEPTNDLDVDTLRALEEALLGFAGCAIVISHDRWFLDRIATHMLAFEGDSTVVWFEGNYQDYEADRRRRLGDNGSGVREEVDEEGELVHVLGHELVLPPLQAWHGAVRRVLVCFVWVRGARVSPLAPLRVADRN